MILLAFLTSLAISMAIIPLMIRLAPRLNMVDLPDPRKVHAKAIPRVGGIGIASGSLAAVALWLPAEPWIIGYQAASLVLLGFGAADDAMELGHYTKFVGQIIAALIVVYFGDVWVANVPFLSSPIPGEVGKPFTVFALVGVMNAINHSDGLDGLAGGESLLSMAAIAYLAHLAGGGTVVMLAACVVGGVFGFLRFNTHPARVFMGDSGSQFIGFSLAVLAVQLTQRVNPDVSMALPLLLIGLPIIDILAVFAQRVSGGMNWFRATRNHVHHRLLDLGFSHRQTVVLIYSVQAMLVSASILLCYESDLVVTATYALVSTLVFLLLLLAERSHWKFRDIPSEPAPLNRVWRALPELFIRATVPAYLVTAGALASSVPFDYALIALAALALAMSSLAPGIDGTRLVLLRLAVYLGAACSVFLGYGPAEPDWFPMLEDVYFVLLGVAVFLALRAQGANGFRTTPLDSLLVMFAMAAATIPGLVNSGAGTAILMMVRLFLLFYAAELLLNGSRGNERDVSRWSVIAISLLLVGKNIAVV